MNEKMILYGVLGFFGLIILSKLIQATMSFFSGKKKYEESKTIHSRVRNEVQPYLGSLEKKFEHDPDSGKDFGDYVHELVKDKFADKNEKLVKKAVTKCCSDYANAECKEDFCLEGSGISCNKNREKKEVD